VITYDELAAGLETLGANVDARAHDRGGCCTRTMERTYHGNNRGGRRTNRRVGIAAMG